MPQYHKSSTQIKLDRALSERTLLQTRLMKFRTTADLIHDEMSQTRKDQRAAPWERFGQFELKLQDLEMKLSVWEEKIVDVEDRLVRLDEYCEELFALEEGEKEKYDCAIGTSILLTLLFAYDGVVMGLPHLNFWIYLALPHTLLGLGVTAYIWKRGIMHGFPIAYVLGFTVLLALAFMHQQNFLRNQNDWRGMKALLSHALQPPQGGYITIESGQELSAAERLNAVGDAIKDYWRNFINYTNHMAAAT